MAIASVFMSINGPIEKVDNFVLCARNTDTSRVEIEGHVLVTLNAHELVVESQDRVTQWPFLEVSPHFFQCHIIFFINIKLLIEFNEYRN